MNNIITLDNFGLDLDYGNPLAPDWATRADGSGSSAVARAYSHKYPGDGRFIGSDGSFEVSRGWRSVNGPNTGADQMVHIQFDHVGRTTDGDFTMAAVCTMEDGTETFGWVMGKGGNTGSAFPTIAIGYRAVFFRAVHGWDGTATTLGSNDDVKKNVPYFVSFVYDSSADTIDLRYFNLDTHAVLSHNTTGKTFPSTVDPQITLGAYRRSGTSYNDPMEGVIDKAYWWDKTLNADQLDYLALNHHLLWKQAPNFKPTVAVVGDTNILATTDTLVITENAVTVNAETNISATTDTLVITEQAATVGLGSNILATTDTLIITEFQANVNAETNINATTDTLVLTEFSASIAEATEILATTDNLVITEQQANVNAATNISATTDTLIITENTTTVSLGVNVAATTDTLVITEQATTVNAATNILATADALIITEFQATITGAVAGSALIDGSASQTITVNFGEMALYFNGTNYFRI